MRVSRWPIRPNERTGGLSCSHDSIDHERSSAGACFRPFARPGPGCRRLDSSLGVGTRTAQPAALSTQRWDGHVKQGGCFSGVITRAASS
jgi:hypothetical protein